MQIAQTILDQLGGRRFVVMTGARNLGGTADSLSFKLPSNTSKNKATHVKVTLAKDDTYTVEFFRFRGTKGGVIATHTGIYADLLASLFTEETGLAVSL